MKAIIFTLGALAIMSTGCRSVEKMIDQGDFETALLKSARKISGQDQIKRRYVLAIEEAFRKSTASDMAVIEKLYDSDRAEDWHKVIRQITRIETRQNLITPFLPMRSSDGYQAVFSFVRSSDLLKNAKARFLELTYRDASRMLEKARLGDKAEARNVYHTFARLWEYSQEYLDARNLQEEAASLGVSHVAVRFENVTGRPIPESLLDEVLNLNLRDEKWVHYHDRDEIAVPDREITVVINALNISPERIEEHNYVDSKEIQDGFEYVLDQHGNVAKDSLGNDIKQPRFQKIAARVIEGRQVKTAQAAGYIHNQNLVNGHLEKVPFQSEIVFEHFYATFRGDRRALSPESKRFLGITPAPFPDDQQMVFDLIHTLSPIIRDKVKNLKLLV